MINCPIFESLILTFRRLLYTRDAQLNFGLLALHGTSIEYEFKRNKHRMPNFIFYLFSLLIRDSTNLFLRK